MAERARVAYPYARIAPAAEELAKLLAPGCERIEVAGSIRRQCKTCHDIDLVAQAKYTSAVLPSLFGEPQILRGGPDQLVNAIRALMINLPIPPADVRILRFEWQGYPVEVYLSEPDGSNFGALLQMRTGSTAFNQWIIKRCRANNYYYKAGHGIYLDDTCRVRVDDGTEEGIFRVLGLPYTGPELRDY